MCSGNDALRCHYNGVITDVRQFVGLMNNIPLPADGGTHPAVEVALTRTPNAIAQAQIKLSMKMKSHLSGEHVREGLNAIISVKVPDPNGRSNQCQSC